MMAIRVLGLFLSTGQRLPVNILKHRRHSARTKLFLESLTSIGGEPFAFGVSENLFDRLRHLLSVGCVGQSPRPCWRNDIRDSPTLVCGYNRHAEAKRLSGGETQALMHRGESKNISVTYRLWNGVRRHCTDKLSDIGDTKLHGPVFE
jgi:hypothetical protein